MSLRCGGAGGLPRVGMLVGHGPGTADVVGFRGDFRPDHRDKPMSDGSYLVVGSGPGHERSVGVGRPASNGRQHPDRRQAIPSAWWPAK